MIDIQRKRRLNPIARTSQWTMKRLLRLCGTKVRLQNIQNAKGDSILFVANHFTRFETFLLPYLILKETGQLVNNIAAMGIFGSKFWSQYLAKLGVHPLKFSKRDEVIVGDLAFGRANWLIYPESGMIRNKKVRNPKGELCLEAPFHKGFPRTGAASLALRSLSKRKELLQLSNRKGLSPALVKHLIEQKIRIVPITISYYPIRSAATWVKPFMGKFVGRSSRIAHEEGMVEGHLILHSEVVFDFHEPIDVEEYLQKNPTTNFPKLKPAPPKTSKKKAKEWSETSHHQALRYALTNDFMRQIYNAIPINMDHLFLATIRELRRDSIPLSELKTRLCTLHYETKRSPLFNVHPNLDAEVDLLLTGESNAFNSILRQAIQEGLVERIEHETLRLRKETLNEPCNFHKIRLKNLCQVLCNEMLGIGDFASVAKQLARRKPANPKDELSRVVSLYDKELYEEDRKKTFDAALSKPASKSRPFFLKGSKEMGVVLSHGYGASPGEVRSLADYLHKTKGWSVYGVRLKGHGTIPKELASVQWQEWYDSYKRGLYVVENYCSSVVLGGTSTGGLMALITLGKLGRLGSPNNIKGIFTINTPIVLKNKKHHLASAMHFSNLVMKRFNLNTFSYDSVPTNTEFPETNYKVYYIKSVVQLKTAIDAAKAELKHIQKPLLVIQSKGDPVVEASSAQFILSKSNSVEKKYYEIPSSRHTVVRREGKEQVFGQISYFISNL